MSQSSRRRPQRANPLTTLAVLLLVVLLVLSIFAAILAFRNPDSNMESTPGQTTGSTEGTTTNPTGGTTQPTDPTTNPTDPSSQPTDPTDPTTKPTDPTDPSTQPTDPSSSTNPVDLEKFFSESVFIGDSVTLKLRNYCVTHPDALYGAKILCAGSYAVRHAITEPEPGNSNIVSITYQGAEVRPEDALAQIGAKRVFIMLGMNDIAFGVDYTLNNWKILIDNIRAKNPDIEIYIQSGTPIHASKDRDGYKLNNANMDIYNQRLQEFCQTNGCYYVELNSYFKDANGDLADAYCSDPYSASNPNGQGCHFTDAGVELWIRLLKDFASNR